MSVRPLPETEALVKLGEGKEARVASPQWDQHALCSSYRLGRSTLVAVCNLHDDKPAAVRVRVADAAEDHWLVYDPLMDAALVPEEGKTWTGASLARGILYEVPPSSLGTLVIAPSAPQSGFKREVREAEVRSRFQAHCRKVSASGSAGPLRSGGLEISWADTDADGNAEVRLASSHQELGIGASGNLWTWKVRGHEHDLVNRFDGGGACVDQFWWPEEARSSTDKRGEYELVKRELGDGRATVVMRRALAHWTLGGLIIEKAYSITAGGSKLEVRVTVRNESPDVHEVSYWSHNCFRVGEAPALSLTTEKGAISFSGDQQPRSVFAPRSSLPPDQAALLGKANTAPVTEPVFTLGDRANLNLVIRAERDPLLQVYRWWDGTRKGRYTIEWMYQKQTLATSQAWTTRFSVEAKGPRANREIGELQR